jgi:hypothetical protein
MAALYDNQRDKQTTASVAVPTSSSVCGQQHSVRG